MDDYIYPESEMSDYQSEPSTYHNNKAESSQ